MDTTAIAHHLAGSLLDATDEPTFLPLVRALVEVFNRAGLQVGRLQLPLNRAQGFRHPTLATLLLTWNDTDGEAHAQAVTHSEAAIIKDSRLVRSPYWVPLQTGEPYRARLSADTGFALLNTLHEQGYVDYVALPLPSGVPDQFQVMSVASRAPFPEDLCARLSQLEPLLTLAIYAAYRKSQAVAIANAYIGPTSGPRVLAGEIRRGSTRRLRAGIVFCDIRGFTALSERLGAEEVVRVVNEVFERVGEEAQLRGGEIMKFIGDAVLMVFPVDQESEPQVAQNMVEAATRTLARLAEDGVQVQVGFGGHIGEVVQGNIGTPERVDFTVLGPAVNLASRLESLSKPLAAQGVFSESVATHVTRLKPGGTHGVKGIEDPVSVWLL